MGLDEELFRAVNLGWAHPGLDAVFLTVALAGLAYVFLAAAVPLWLRASRALAVDYVVALVVVLALTEAIKFAVGRPRPFEVLPDARYLALPLGVDVGDPAFPSGHAARAFFVLAFLWGPLPRWRPPLAAFAVLTAVGRIYVGAHWPSDVLGGAILGVAVAWTLARVFARPAWIRVRARILREEPSSVPGGRSGSPPRTPPSPGTRRPTPSA